MIQNSIMVDDEQSTPASNFRPLLEKAKSSETALVSLEFVRSFDGRMMSFQIFQDRVVGVWKGQTLFILLDDEVSFGFSLKDKKFWFKGKENNAIDTFTTDNSARLQQFVNQLRTRCPQQNFAQSYQLLEQKGKGKKSCVYEARRLSDGSSFAVKIQQYTSGFRREIQILRELQHPNLIYLQEYFIDSDHQAYIVMDYEDGGSLLDIIRANQSLSPKDKFKIMTDMLNALEYLRLKGIVHRDLKPQNILYSKKDGNYKIADFGLSRRAGDRIDKIAGTPGYIAPELLTGQIGELEADIKSDIYSMGLVFFEILTSHQYYQGKNSQQILKKNMEKVSLKKKKVAEIGKMEYTLLQKMIRSDPQKRKSSYQILKSALFSKINKIYGLDYLSSTSPSKKVNSEQDQNNKNVDEGLVDSFWKLLRIRSWSN